MSKKRAFEKGKVYILRLTDCCIEGIIEAGKFSHYDKDKDRFIFANCQIGPDWGAWDIKRED